MRDYRNLEVWNLGRRFAVLCYELTNRFPREELYNLTCQIRRAGVSISANIAEGVGRDSDAELLRFIRISLGSLNEVETLFTIACDLGFIDETQLGPLEQMSRDLGVKLRNLATKLEADVAAKRGKGPNVVKEIVSRYLAETEHLQAAQGVAELPQSQA